MRVQQRLAQRMRPAQFDSILSPESPPFLCAAARNAALPSKRSAYWLAMSSLCFFASFEAEPPDLDRRTAVHHHFEARGLGAFRGILVDDAELHPHRPGAGEDRLIDRIARYLRSAKDVDDVDREADLRQVAP